MPSTNGLLIDRHLPSWDFAETHRRLIDAGCVEAFDMARHLDFSSSWLTRSLLRIRGLRVTASLDGLLETGLFRVIAEEAPEEFVIWLEDAGKLEIAWNFHFEPRTEHSTLVTTMTRVRCLTPKSRRWFRLYWFMIRPFSGLIRREMLRCMQMSARR